MFTRRVSALQSIKTINSSTFQHKQVSSTACSVFFYYHTQQTNPHSLREHSAHTVRGAHPPPMHRYIYAPLPFEKGIIHFHILLPHTQFLSIKLQVQGILTPNHMHICSEPITSTHMGTHTAMWTQTPASARVQTLMHSHTRMCTHAQTHTSHSLSLLLRFLCRKSATYLMDGNCNVL